MITFQHMPTGKLIGTSRKVMTSFFDEHPAFEQVPACPVDYFLARNPYDRVISLFSDKCRKSVHPFKVQKCQTDIANQAGIDVHELPRLSFTMFCNLLQALRYKDEHFWPQLTEFMLAPRGVIIRIECGGRHGLKGLGLKLGVNFAPKVNATSHISRGRFFPRKGPSGAIVRRVYRQDFELFCYPSRA